MRLRSLTEAECYARCYGGRREESVSILRFGFGEDTGDRAPDPLDRPGGSEAGEVREAA